jgi:hypothetical protein
VAENIRCDKGVKRGQVTRIYRIRHRGRNPNVCHFVCHARQRKNYSQQDP